MASNPEGLKSLCHLYENAYSCSLSQLLQSQELKCHLHWWFSNVHLWPSPFFWIQAWIFFASSATVSVSFSDISPPVCLEQKTCKASVCHLTSLPLLLFVMLRSYRSFCLLPDHVTSPSTSSQSVLLSVHSLPGISPATGLCQTFAYSESLTPAEFFTIQCSFMRLQPLTKPG